MTKKRIVVANHQRKCKPTEPTEPTPLQIAIQHYETNKTGAYWRGHESND